MTDSTLTQPTADQRAQLNYIQWKEDFKTEKPYEVISDMPEGHKRRNFTLEAGPEEVIRDVRGSEAAFNLDDNGFEVRRHEMAIRSFDPNTIESHYLPSIMSLLQEIDPGAEVHVFDWRLRSSNKTKTTHKLGTLLDLNSKELILEPVQAVHNDQSPRGAIKRVRTEMGPRADELLNRRFRIINTVPPEKLLAVDHVRKYHIGESLYPLYCDTSRWYYLNGQSKDEALLFKTYDSSPKAAAKCCPHTSFHQHQSGPLGHPRETIEVRALVFSRDDGLSA
ncbi:hypothetical protein B0T22DRAFT_375046 [Podospora appendiculata]|uniref:Methyltransferase n=1 Tax=Podospora appendiculata TaxID=314037 RepID=A0AAE0X867_9PEZI|nr:hypothetical protein B0T22DRAFT_375046 [Podospora appendiculata]